MKDRPTKRLTGWQTIFKLNAFIWMNIPKSIILKRRNKNSNTKQIPNEIDKSVGKNTLQTPKPRCVCRWMVVIVKAIVSLCAQTHRWMGFLHIFFSAHKSKKSQKFSNSQARWPMWHPVIENSLVWTCIYMCVNGQRERLLQLEEEGMLSLVGFAFRKGRSFVRLSVEVFFSRSSAFGRPAKHSAYHSI